MYKYLLRRSLHNPDLLLCEAVQLLDQPVNLPVYSLDAAGDQRPLMLRAGGGESLVQVEHGLHQLHHAVVWRGILLVAESKIDLKPHQFFQRPIVSRASLSETILS